MAADHTPFLQAIADHPDDDSPRLVYADWLEEHGDAARAEFIRVQCEFARLPESDPRYRELSERWNGILNRHRRDWLGGARAPTSGVIFRRGFINVITATLTAYLDAAEIWERLAPVHVLNVCPDPALTDELRLRLEDACRPNRLDPVVAELRVSGLPARWVGLRWPDDRLAPSVLARFGPHDLPRLELLDLKNGRHVAPLPMPVGPAFGRLKSLELFAGVDESNGDRVLDILAGSAALANLRRLNFGHNGLTDAGLRALAETSHLTHLRELVLAHNLIARPGVQALAEAPFALEELDLSDNPAIEDAALAELADAPVFAGLKRLNLTRIDTGDAGLLRLIESPNAAGLESLTIGSPRLTDEAILALARSDHLTELRHLDLSGMVLSPADARALAETRLPRLERLEVRRGGLDRLAGHALRQRFGDGLRVVSYSLAR